MGKGRGEEVRAVVRAARAHGRDANEAVFETEAVAGSGGDGGRCTPTPKQGTAGGRHRARHPAAARPGAREEGGCWRGGSQGREGALGGGGGGTPLAAEAAESRRGGGRGGFGVCLGGGAWQRGVARPPATVGCTPPRPESPEGQPLGRGVAVQLGRSQEFFFAPRGRAHGRAARARANACARLGLVEHHPGRHTAGGGGGGGWGPAGNLKQPCRGPVKRREDCGHRC